MADDNNARYRSNDAFDRAPAQAAPASDPLAELARLIGRNDPFAEYAREPRPPAPPDAGAGYGGNPAPVYGNLPAPPYGIDPAPGYSDPAYGQDHSQDHSQDYGQEHAQEHAQEPAQDYSQPAAPRYAADYQPRYDNQAARNEWPGSPSTAPSYPSADPFALPSQKHAPPLSAPPYDPQGYTAPGYGSQQSYADPHDRAAMDSRLAGFNAAGYPAGPDGQGYAPPLYPNEPESGSMPAPHDDEFYDDAPHGARRKGLLTVAAVLGLAVIGTAGAFGYRSMFGGSGSSAPPPVIRASGEPSKVAPPPATSDASASKFSYDRFGDAGKDEQVVRREEKPVDLTRAAPPPRTVFPGAPPAATPPPTRPTGSATTATAPPSAIGEPRRVRTVPIRPDQGGDVASAPPAQLPTLVAPSRQGSAAVASAAVQPPDDAAATRAAPPRASPRVASRPSQPAAAPAANAPLSLSPDANNNALPPPSAPDNPPPRAYAAPMRTASAPAAGGGSYLVQVSSQKSEADAESAYRSIQSKYSSVLGGHPHQVRRADLGSKGVYYRAMVGPFASREAAVQICSSLKQAGGDCVVQH